MNKRKNIGITLRIQAPATISVKIYAHGIWKTSLFIVDFTVYVHMYIFKVFINWKIETRQKETFIDYIVLRKHWIPSTVHSIQLEYHSVQRSNERHSRIKLFMTLLKVTIINTEGKIIPFNAFLPSMHLHLIFWITLFLANNKYKSFVLVFQVLIFVVVLTYCVQCRSKTKWITNFQTNIFRINLISIESFLFALEIFHLIWSLA